MLDTLFLLTAVVGGTVMVCQFLLTLLGLGDDLASDGDVGAELSDAGLSDGHMADDLGEEGHHPTPIHDAAEADIDHPGSSWLFQMLSLRSIVAALTFFGLGGAWSSSSGQPPAVALLVGLAAGGAALVAMYRLMQAVYGLRTSGTVDIRNAIGQPAKIYLPVPPTGTGKGKIQVSFQGRVMEYEAITDEPETLTTGETVFVEAIAGSDLLKVTRA